MPDADISRPAEAPPLQRHEKTNYSIISAALLSIFICSALVRPGSIQLPACGFYEITGKACPSCGMTRSFQAFSRLDAAASFRFHPLGPLTWISLMLVLIVTLVRLVNNRRVLHVNTAYLKAYLGIYLLVYFGVWFVTLF